METDDVTDNNFVSKEILYYSISVEITDENGNVVSKLESSKNDQTKVGSVSESGAKSESESEKVKTE
jgi:hypothetical protein